MWNSIPVLWLILLPLLLLLLAVVLGPGVLAKAIAARARFVSGKTPADYGLSYEDVTIQTADGVDLAGWLIPGTNNKVVILGHPGIFTKYGYDLSSESRMTQSGYDRDVEFCPLAKALHEEGYTVLMYDQRNHGQSGFSPRGRSDLTEAYRDTVAVVDFVAQHPQYGGQDIGLMSFCQNSYIAMEAMSKAKEALRQAGVRTFIAVQPSDAATALRKLKYPRWVVRLLERACEASGIFVHGMRPSDYASDVFVPALMVLECGGPWPEARFNRELFDAIPTEKRALWIKTKPHQFDAYNYFSDQPAEILGWLATHLPSRSSTFLSRQHRQVS